MTDNQNKDNNLEVASEGNGESITDEVKSNNLDIEEDVVSEDNLEPEDLIRKLREKLKACQKECSEYLAGWQRAKADLINARQRDEADKKDFVKFANERLIDGLLPVLDSFELAFNNKESWEKADKNWRSGVEFVYQQLKKTLTDAGLEEINPFGEKFDPARDEVAEYLPVESESNEHKILAVVQKGYSLNGRPMRPPKVRVGEIKKV